MLGESESKTCKHLHLEGPKPTLKAVEEVEAVAERAMTDRTNPVSRHATWDRIHQTTSTPTRCSNASIMELPSRDMTNHLGGSCFSLQCGEQE